MLDHVSLEQGRAYLSYIAGSYPQLLSAEKIKIVKEIDSLGNPLSFSFPRYGNFSPTILRYIKVLGDLENYFGDIREFVIAEIGVGFGGQSLILNRLAGVDSYVLYDLPPVMNLASRFISENAENFPIVKIDGRGPRCERADLLISNYAFSELSREIQVSYIENVILKANRGYITWNSLSFRQLDGFSVAELLRLIPGADVRPEYPLTSPDNLIIVWGNKKGT